MKNNQNERDHAYGELLRKNIEPNNNNIKKYRLWQESKERCIYSGDSIGFEDIFYHEGICEIDHIVPKTPKDSRFINLILCKREKNQEKGKHTPYQVWGKTEKWEAIKALAKKNLPYPKYLQLVSEKAPKEDTSLLQKDLDTTGYITKAATTYLGKISKNIHTPKGSTTALLRKKWKLDNLLSPTITMPAHLIQEQKEEAIAITLLRDGNNGDDKNKKSKNKGIYYVAYRQAPLTSVQHNLIPQKTIVDAILYQPPIPTIPLEEIKKKQKSLKKEEKEAKKDKLTHLAWEEEDKNLKEEIESINKEEAAYYSALAKEGASIEAELKKRYAKEKKNKQKDGKLKVIECQVIEKDGTYIAIENNKKNSLNLTERTISSSFKIAKEGTYYLAYTKERMVDIMLYKALTSTSLEGENVAIEDSIQEQATPKGTIEAAFKARNLTFEVIECQVTKKDGSYIAIENNKENSLNPTERTIPSSFNIAEEGTYYLAYAKEKMVDAMLYESPTSTSIEELNATIEDLVQEQVTLENQKEEAIAEKNKALKKDLEQQCKEVKKDITALKKQIKVLEKSRKEAKKVLEKALKDRNSNLEVIRCQVIEKDDGTYLAIPQEAKNRTDHRHHIVDALVIATTTLSQQQQYNRASGQGKDYKDLEKIFFTPPWENFKKDVRNVLKEVFVSIKQNNKALTLASKKARVPIYPDLFNADPSKKQPYKVKTLPAKGLTAHGQLHNDTLYGKYTNNKGETVYHHRKSITKGNVKKIVDKTIREKAVNFLAQRSEKEIKTNLFLPNKRDGGEDVPIKKVRIFENKSKMVALYGKNRNSYVDPCSNHIAAIYKQSDGSWKHRAYSLLEIVQRKKDRKPLVPKKYEETDGKLCLTLYKQDLVLLDAPSFDKKNPDYALLSPFLYRLQIISQTIKDNGEREPVKYVFRHHLAATIDINLEEINLSGKNFKVANPIKVKVDMLGKIVQIIDPTAL